MNLEVAKVVIEKLKADDSFRSKVMAAEDLEGRMKLIHDEGFDCNLEEIKEVVKNLSDDDLESVAGGVISKESYCSPIRDAICLI